MQGRNVVVIGASAGGIPALTQLLAQLPVDLNAAILIVLHIGDAPSLLPRILDRACRLPVVQAVDGEQIVAKHVYVAPPDLHMMIEDGRIRLVHGPKENFTRPAIDPLFRSAAIWFGSRVVGVVLTGRLDDGAAGLLAVKDRGGIAIVQDPAEATHPSMPERAIAAAPVDHVCMIADMGKLLVDYDPPALQLPPVPRLLELEHKITAMQAFLSEGEELERVGVVSPLTCPECHGVLYQLRDERLLRFRCRAGHAMSGHSLLSHIASDRENTIWSAIRALTEEAWLSRKVKGEPDAAADALLKQAEALRALIDSPEGGQFGTTQA